MQLPVPSRTLPTAQAVAEAAAAMILAQADHALAARALFSIVLAGGTTPEAAYRLLARAERSWTPWRFYFGDERCLPPEHPERNSVMAANAWLEPAGIPGEQVFRIPAESGPEAAAAAYASVVSSALPFDLVLLGVGEDGHTASLFPQRSWPPQALVIPVDDAPKAPPERVSLTPKALTSARRMLILATGSGKHQALDAWRRGDDLPIARVAATAETLVLMDEAAARG